MRKKKKIKKKTLEKKEGKIIRLTFSLLNDVEWVRNRVLSRARTSCKTIKRLREKERTWGEIFRICVLHSKRRRGHESRFPSDSVLRNFSISRRRHFIILYSLCSYHYYYYYYLINFFTIFPHNKFGKLFFFKKKKN